MPYMRQDECETTIYSLTLRHSIVFEMKWQQQVMLFTDIFFFSSRRRHTRLQGDWSSDVCSSDLQNGADRAHWACARSSSLSWTEMMTGRKPNARDLRRFVMTRPMLDFSGLE